MPSSNLAESPPPVASSEAEAHYAAACRLWDAGGARRDRAPRHGAPAQPGFAGRARDGRLHAGEMGKPEAALRFYGRALALDLRLACRRQPTPASCLSGSRRPAEALEAFEAATALKPADADAWNGRAGALRELGRLEELVTAARRALALKPDFPRRRSIRQRAPETRPDGGGAAGLPAARAARPDYAPALCGEALALRNLGHYGEALAAFEAAEALGSGEAVAGKGCLLLTLGDFEPGFEGYEARWLTGKSLTEALGTRYPTWAGPGKPGPRPRAQRSRARRHDPVRSLSAADGGGGGRGHLRLSVEAASPSQGDDAFAPRRGPARRAVRRTDRREHFRAPSTPGSTRFRPTFPILPPSRPFPRGGPRGSRRRLQDRRRLAGQPPSRGGSGALLSAGGGGGAGVAPRRPPRRAAKGLWRRADRRPSARDEGRNAGRGIHSGRTPLSTRRP